MDDRERDRYVMRGVLAALGRFEIFETHRGEEALDRARAAKPDVIFLDLMLPDITGFEILERLKSDVETKDIPVIVNTSKVLEETERDRLIAHAVADYRQGQGYRQEVIAEVRESLIRAGVYPPVA